MAYSQQQQQSNLVYFMTAFFDPAIKAARAFEILDESTQKYVTMSLLEAFFWLHLGVKLNYFPEVLSRRVFYEYGNKLLAAYQRILNAKMETRFSPPLQRILDGELTGRVALFGSNEQLPTATDEITSAYQSTFLLVSGLLKEGSAQIFFRDLLFATPEAWVLAVGDYNKLGLDVSVSEDAVKLARQWGEPTKEGLLRVIEFMQGYRNLFEDLNQLFKNSTQSSEQMLLLRRNLREIQQWRLDFVSASVRDRFIDFARVTMRMASDEIKKGGGETAPDIEGSIIPAVYNLLIDWGAPHGARSATG
jgi:hypothetical protein